MGESSVDFTDFDAFVESALLAGTVRDGLGCHAVKSGAGVPLRDAFFPCCPIMTIP